MPEHRDVFRGMILSDPAVVFIESMVTMNPSIAGIFKS
jgi:hypothetical protein